MCRLRGSSWAAFALLVVTEPSYRSKKHGLLGRRRMRQAERVRSSYRSRRRDNWALADRPRRWLPPQTTNRRLTEILTEISSRSSTSPFPRRGPIKSWTLRADSTQGVFKSVYERAMLAKSDWDIPPVAHHAGCCVKRLLDRFIFRFRRPARGRLAARMGDKAKPPVLRIYRRLCCPCGRGQTIEIRQYQASVLLENSSNSGGRA